MKSLGMIGYGKMGHALLKGMVHVLNVPVVVCDVNEAALADVSSLGLSSVTTTTRVADVASACDAVILAVKPAQAEEVLASLGKKALLISIVAGLTLARIEKGREGQFASIVRIMPNTPALVGAGSIVAVDHALTEETKNLVVSLFASCGAVHFVKSESQLDAVTGLSGSGPALFAVIAEALADAAVAEGLPRALAKDLARETMLGTAKLMEKEHPALLKENVMSPGGTTAAGILASERAGIRSACAEFVCAASQKSRSL